jgi:excinuclease ABC subunit A
MNFIQVRGARTHNLKNIDVRLPRDALVVITGLSGSGKSSLAFDTLYAEGQRRYVESLSTYARQFLSMMEKPDVDLIEGLSPAIAIEQKATSHNPRSTTATVTEVYDYLRLLYARVGQPRCPTHASDLTAQTVKQMVEQILTLPAGSKIMLLAPIVQQKKGESLRQLDTMRTQGFVRARVDGQFYQLDEELPVLNPKKKHDIAIVVDRLIVEASYADRLADSLETTLNLSQGVVIVALYNDNYELIQELVLSNKFACPLCGYSLSELEPKLFSFNSPAGACKACDGLGQEQFMDLNKILIDENLSLAAGAIRGWDKQSVYAFNILNGLSKHYDFSLDTPFKKLGKKIQNLVLYGNNGEVIKFKYYTDTSAAVTRKHAFEGIIPSMERRYRETDSNYIREELAKYLSQQACQECKGSRLNLSARNIFMVEKNIADITQLSISDAIDFFNTLNFEGWRVTVAAKITKEIITRLSFLRDVGLGYLQLNRGADTLSGGEAQRIRLASQIGAGLVGVMYVLDEPSIGLHQRDNTKLIKTLLALRDLGNTVIVVEHDTDTIIAADHVIDIGPGAGIHGGEVIASCAPAMLKQQANSLTGRYLSGLESIAVPIQRQQAPEQDGAWLTVHTASENNLKDITVAFPVGLFTCITGVSGSGKSTLINDTLYPALAKALNRAQPITIGKHSKITGIEHFDKVIDITQTPIGRTPRSNPATYTGCFSDIRDLFAETVESRARGYKPGRFSFNVTGGRCEVCSGDGIIRVEMHFLADVYVTCDACQGKRYNHATLEILYKGKNIYEILDMTVEEAVIFFQPIPSIYQKLLTLLDVGLGYIRLGQSATTLSGGEAQRIKLAKELSRKDTGKTLYILDEPTTGLHIHDVKRLLQVLNSLKQRGNSIIVVEHNLDVIKTADWLIDLGPEGGDGGGEVVASGTPETVAANPNSYTGQFLRDYLA